MKSSVSKAKKTTIKQKPLTPAAARSEIATVRAWFGNPKRQSAKPATFVWATWTAVDIVKAKNEALAALRSSIKNLQNRKPESRTFENTISEYSRAWARFSGVTAKIEIHLYVSPDKKTRDAAQQALKFLEKEGTKLSMDRATYALLKPLLAEVRENPIEEKIRDQYLKTFKLLGFELSLKDQKKLQSLNSKITGLELAFSQAAAEKHYTLTLHPEKDIGGLSASFLDRLPRDAKGNYVISTRSASDYGTFLENSERRELRKQIMVLFNQVGGKENLTRLQKLRELRHEKANLLGFKRFVDMQTEVNTAAGSYKRVSEFVNSLKKLLFSEAVRDVEMLKTYAKKHMGMMHPLQSWDLGIITNHMTKQIFSVDEESLREYFPLTITIRKAWDMWEKLLGIVITETKKFPTWHPSVRSYEFKTKEGVPLGYLSLDMFPREGKYSHQGALAHASDGYQEGDAYVLPHGVIILNVPEGKKGKEVGLTSYELSILLHESGHALHQILTRVPYVDLSGTKVTPDFVELPSQFAESWGKDAIQLQKLSSPTPAGKTLSKATVERIVLTEGFMKAVRLVRQLRSTAFDLLVHETPKGDVMGLWRKSGKGLSFFPDIPGSIYPARFVHIAGGYEARYWTYLWAEQYIAQCWQVFEQGGLLSSKLGNQYREMILEMGGTVDPEILVTAFSGKRPGAQAFQAELKKLIKKARTYVAQQEK